MCSANNCDHFSTLLFIFSSLLASSSPSQGYSSQMDGHSAGNRQGVISYTRALGCGTAGRKRRVIILHLGAAGNEFLHKDQIYHVLFMLASIFPAGSIYWANSPLSVYGQGHGSAPLVTLYCRGAPQGTIQIKQVAGFTRSRLHPPFLLNYIPETAESSQFHLVLMMHAGVWNQISKSKRGKTILWGLTGGNWKTTFLGEIRWLWGSGNFLFIFSRAGHRWQRVLHLWGYFNPVTQKQS